MKKLNKITAGLVCLALSAGVMAQGVTDDEVVLGTSTALSGPAALWGVSASRAAQIRFDMANERRRCARETNTCCPGGSPISGSNPRQGDEQIAEP